MYHTICTLDCVYHLHQTLDEVHNAYWPQVTHRFATSHSLHPGNLQAIQSPVRSAPLCPPCRAATFGSQCRHFWRRHTARAFGRHKWRMPYLCWHLCWRRTEQALGKANLLKQCIIKFCHQRAKFANYIPCPIGPYQKRERQFHPTRYSTSQCIKYRKGSPWAGAIFYVDIRRH